MNPTSRVISLRLQQRLREALPALYFRDLLRYVNRPAAYAVLVYQASQLWYGTRTEITRDVADPKCLDAALRGIGKRLGWTMTAAGLRLHRAGFPSSGYRNRCQTGLVRAPRRDRRIFSLCVQDDALRMVRQKPARLLTLLADEAHMIEALVSQREEPDSGAVARVAKRAGRHLNLDYREVHEVLLREAWLAAADISELIEWRKK